MHSRFVQPFLDFTQILIGLPFILTALDRNLVRMVASCLIIFALFYAITFGLRTLGAHETLLTASAGAWAPVLLFAPVALAKSVAAITVKRDFRIGLERYVDCTRFLSGGVSSRLGGNTPWFSRTAVTIRYQGLSADEGVANFASEADLAAEEVIMKTIREQFPEHTILAEESNLPVADDAEHLWVIDPLDGTNNFCMAFLTLRCLNRLLQSRKPVVGIVFNPISNELYSAIQVRGHGRGRRDNTSPCATARRSRHGMWFLLRSRTDDANHTRYDW